MGFPERLQSIIEERQISKYKIAKAIDISASTVSNYLKGKTKTGFNQINRTKQTFRSKQRMASNRRRLQIYRDGNRWRLHKNIPGSGRQTHE